MNKTANSFMQKTVSKKGSKMTERDDFDADEKASAHDSDDNKSYRSKKSMSSRISR